MTPSEDSDPYFLDRRHVRRAFDRASAQFDRFAAVHADIRARLLERLDVVRLQPAVVLDLGAGTGHGARALQARYADAYVVAADLSAGMLRQARGQQRFFKRFGRVALDAHQLAFKSASVDLVFSNLMLQWCSDPDFVFAELARVLRPGGLLTFSTLGPDTLKELRHAFGTISSAVHVHRFIDMHDLGDALMRAGFAEPVMDTERLTVTYRDYRTLLSELKGTGSTNVAHGRRRSLQPKGRASAARQRYENAYRPDELPLSLEVVYGHAWASDNLKTSRDPNVFGVPVAKIGRRIR